MLFTIKQNHFVYIFLLIWYLQRLSFLTLILHNHISSVSRLLGIEVVQDWKPVFDTKCFSSKCVGTSLISVYKADLNPVSRVVTTLAGFDTDEPLPFKEKRKRKEANRICDEQYERTL